MNVWAISDLHLGFKKNCDLLSLSGSYLDDYLVLVGDIGETKEHLQIAFDFFGPRFKKIIWVPGNHELWLEHNDIRSSEDKYQDLVEFCERQSVVTPESPFELVTINDKMYYLVPMFLFYDYSFKPDHIKSSEAVSWASEMDICCADEVMIRNSLFKNKIDWCIHRVGQTESRLKALDPSIPTILINHFPLKKELTSFLKIPRFEIWCGTDLTNNWHIEYNAAVVIYGHLHIRTTRWIDNVIFEEVSLGYPGQWDNKRHLNYFIRRIDPTSRPNSRGLKVWY